MAWQPQTMQWPADRAVLFVHGVGDPSPGDYDALLETFRGALGDNLAPTLAIYFLYYDDLNDWFAQKVQLKGAITTGHPDKSKSNSRTGL